MTPKDFPQDYTAVRWLGEGSVGDVWLAQHRETGGHCAIKILHTQGDTRGSAERSFNREVRAMAKLSHPSIIEVYDFGRTIKGSPFVAIENVPGHSLGSYVKGAWTWPQLWGVMDGILAGLNHAHSRELVHRDLKPNNILVIPMVSGLGAIKIVDFGIALTMPDADKVGRRIEGTPAYIAPEAAQGQISSIGPWTDLYSFGVILYEILTGRLPFYGRNLLNHHQHTPPPELRIRSNVDAPIELLPIVSQLLEKFPSARYRSVASLRRALEALPLPEYNESLPAIEEGEDSYLDFSLDSSIDFSLDESMADFAVQESLHPMTSTVGIGLFHLRPPPLVGRKSSQEELESAAQTVLDGKGTSIVLIEGEAGLGKSRLVDWLRARVEEWGLMQVCTVRSEPQRSGGGLRQAILRMMGAPQATLAQADQVLHACLSSPKAIANARSALWPESDPTLSEVEAGIDLESRPRVAAQLLLDVAGGHPLMFWADDAHWSPEGRVLRLMSLLASQHDQSVLLVATLRPTQRRTVRSMRRALFNQGAKLISLEPVPTQTLTTSLSALVKLPEGLVELACAHSGGNPLIAVEAVRGYLRDQGIAQEPRDPSEVLRQKIEQASQGELGQELKSMLVRSTLLGRSFTMKTLAALCEVSGDPLAPLLTSEQELLQLLLDRALQSGLLKEQRQRFTYAHDLIRTELKNLAPSLPIWAELNLKTAALRLKRAESDSTGVELEMVARNYWAGNLKNLALETGLDSLRRLVQSGLMGHATSVTRRLLGWDDELKLLTTEERGELCLMGGEAATHAGHHAEAEGFIDSALQIAKIEKLADLGAKGTVQMALSFLQADRLDKAAHYFAEAQGFLPSCQEPETLSVVYFGLGQWSLAKEEESEAIEFFEESLGYALQYDHLLTYQLAARVALAKVTRAQGQIERAEKLFSRIYQDALDGQLEVHSLEARLGLGLCAWRKGDPETALPYFSEVRKSARGNLFYVEFFAAIGEAWAHALQQDWDKAQMALIQAETLRIDVPHRERELDELRQAMRDYAFHCKRLDLISQIDRLSDLSFSGSTTFLTEPARR
jgi:serine/threonine protein kinase/tetratricopeptide (TPR) repeat protein